MTLLGLDTVPFWGTQNLTVLNEKMTLLGLDIVPFWGTQKLVVK